MRTYETHPCCENVDCGWVKLYVSGKDIGMVHRTGTICGIDDILRGHRDLTLDEALSALLSWHEGQK